jgi:hypothetical protein
VQLQKRLLVEKLMSEITKNQSTAEMQDAKAGATQATAMYDLAMARHMITMAPIEHVKALNDALSARASALAAHAAAISARAGAAKTLAEIGTQHATTDNVRAQTGAHHARAAHERIKALHLAMQPIEHGPPSEVAPPEPVAQAA